VLYPRNLGTSDRTAELNYIDMADDVARFMWENKISTATLAGHGIGGKLALAVGCYHAERVTGIMALDTAPMNQHYIESYQELNSYLSELRHFNTNRSLTNISNDLKKIKCPKWRELFQDNLVKSPQGFTWNFNLEAWAKNLGSGTAESLLNWTKTMGLWVGKTMFAFPEHSRYVYLNTHTLPMQNVCTQLQGFHKDIFSIQGDENPLSTCN
jgi:pimeloyl-ACP methyl ester carboxylesterase